MRRELIVNGENASKGRFPYFAAINHFCGGALIAPDIVLTAGHCRPHHTDDIRVRVGLFSFKNDVEGKDYEEYKILDMERHPLFVHVAEDEFRNDYLLIKIDRQSNRAYIKVNNLDSIPFDGQELIAMGMGFTNPDMSVDSRSDTLRQVTLNYQPKSLCQLSSDPARNLTYQGRIDSSMLCTTGGPDNRRDACACDSGSPIIIPGNSGEGINDLLVGFVSWGEECGDPDFPGVNARVSHGFPWITTTACTMSSNPPEYLCRFKEQNDGQLPARKNGLVSTFTVSAAFLLCLLIAFTTVVRRRCPRSQKSERMRLYSESRSDSTQSYDSMELQMS